MTTKKKVKKVTKKTKTKTKAKKKKVAKFSVKKNYLMMVLDESGSMATIKPQAISAFNEQIKSVKDSRGKLEVCVSLVKFSDQTHTVFKNVDLKKVEALTEETYSPNGFTAMYDGVGRAFEILNSQPDINDPDVTVLVLQAQATGRWTFTYAGANQDLAQVAASLNIPVGNVTAFQATPQGMTSNNVLRSQSSKALYSSYTAGDTLSVQNFYSQTDKEDEKEKSSTT